MTNPRSDVRALEAAVPLASRRELLVGLASGTLVMAGADLLSPASADAATRTGPVTLDEFMELLEHPHR